LPLCSAICFNAATLLSKGLFVAGENNERCLYSNIALLPIVLSPLVIWQWQRLPSGDETIVLLIMGALSFIALQLFNRALARADLSYLLPIGFCKYLIAALFGYIFLGEEIPAAACLGSGYIILGNILMVYFEHSKHIQKACKLATQ